MSGVRRTTGKPGRGTQGWEFRLVLQSHRWESTSKTHLEQTVPRRSISLKWLVRAVAGAVSCASVALLRYLIDLLHGKR